MMTDKVSVLVVESSFSENFLLNDDHFTQEEKFLILHEQITTMINIIPIDVDILVNCEIRDKDFGIFQP